MFGIDVEWLDEPSGVIIRYPARITGQEIIEVLTKIADTPGFEKVDFFVGDRTNVTEMLVSSEEVHEIAALNRRAREQNPEHLVVLISPSDLSFGLSRMYAGHLEQKFIHVCRTRGEAESWLLDQGYRLPTHL